MHVRRFFSFLAIGLVLAGILWVAAIRLTSPASGVAAAPRRFEIPVGGPAAHEPGAVDYARIDARLARLMDNPAMVGLAVAIVEDGEIRFLKGYGETVAGSRDPVTPDTVFRWASLSKGVAGDMLAVLADQGRLSLFEPVNRHAASLRLPGGNEATATVSDLLSHRLGLFGHAQDAKLEDGFDPRYLRSTLVTLRNICSPGQCHAYQNVAYDAASEIVERVTGRPYAEIVQERFFAPLGMTGASMSRAALMGSRSWARPHVGAPRAAGRDQRRLLPRPRRRRGQRLDQGPGDLDAGADGPRRRRPARARPRRGAGAPRQHARREFPPPQISRAHRRLEPTASAGGSSIMPATG